MDRCEQFREKCWLPHPSTSLLSLFLRFDNAISPWRPNSPEWIFHFCKHSQKEEETIPWVYLYSFCCYFCCACLIATKCGFEGKGMGEVGKLSNQEWGELRLSILLCLLFMECMLVEASPGLQFQRCIIGKDKTYCFPICRHKRKNFMKSYYPTSFLNFLARWISHSACSHAKEVLLKQYSHCLETQLSTCFEIS